MPWFEVEIQETRIGYVKVKASSKKRAENLAEDKYNEGEVEFGEPEIEVTDVQPTTPDE